LASEAVAVPAATAANPAWKKESRRNSTKAGGPTPPRVVRMKER
jgi:hypothetical protein